jgi:NH3-dependent NAD+ synthetase
MESVVSLLCEVSSEFEALVEWCGGLIDQKGAPGFVVGLSGTDSILSFLICAEAFRRRGRPERVMGVHFGKDFTESDVDSERLAKILELNPSYRWVSREIVPWLKSVAPNAQIIVDVGSANFDDHARWAKLFALSLVGTSKTEMLDGSQNYWVVGTRNATEEVLGTYSNLSMAASLQPIIHLWKSDVLRICKSLGVPDVAVRQSRQVDCDCGRFDLAADHIEEVDVLLRRRSGQSLLTDSSVELSPDLERRLHDFIDEQIIASAFKRQIPYKPDQNASNTPVNGVGLQRAISDIAGYNVEFSGVNIDRRVMKWLDAVPSGVSSVDFIRKAGLTYGYSFSTWRFPSMTVNGSALLEDFGFTRLRRETDRFDDPALQEPARDLFGPGFIKMEEGRYVELRRAYIMISWPFKETRVTLVIRNNSAYFGRDRLPLPILVSVYPFSEVELQALTPEDFVNAFRSLQDFLAIDAFKARISASARKSSEVMECILDQLESLRRNEVSFHQWLTGRGKCKVLALCAALEAQGRPLPFFGLVDVGHPQWFPEDVAVAGSDLSLVLDDLARKTADGQRRIALLTGFDGDKP